MSGRGDVMLLIADPDDAEADLVGEEMEQWTRVVRLDTADFPQRVGLAATPGGETPGWLRVGGEVVDLRSVKAVYRRSPGVFGLDETMSSAELRFALMEAVQGMGGILSGLSCLWVNHPARVADASYKPIQLGVASRAGLHVPRTLVTNDGPAARKFIADLGGTAIYKPMSVGVLGEDGHVKVVNASLVTADLVDDEGVAKTAHTFQQFVDKRFDVRVTTIGEHSFAVAIHAGNSRSRVDWRADYDSLTYEVIDLPATVARGLRAYMIEVGLTYAAFDFSVDRNGKWWFLEANPNGLWAWIEEQVKVPIARTIAEFMIEEGQFG